MARATKHRHINLSESSPARASLLISRQVQLTEVAQWGSMTRIPVCAVISGGCLISRHRTSKQAASWPIPEINIKSFFLHFGPVELVHSTFARHLIQNVPLCVKSESIMLQGSFIQWCDKFATAVKFGYHL